MIITCTTTAVLFLFFFFLPVSADSRFISASIFLSVKFNIPLSILALFSFSLSFAIASLLFPKITFLYCRLFKTM